VAWTVAGRPGAALLIGSWSTKLVTKITCIHSSSMMLDADGSFDPSRPPENEAYEHIIIATGYYC
jgi:hypothetical protein